MKLIFTLIILLFVGAVVNTINAQIDYFPVRSTPSIFLNSSVSASKEEQSIHFTSRAGASKTSDEPLLVVDGVPYEFNEIKKLNPDDIVSIDILKKEKLFFGCHPPRRDIIVITTKSASTRKFIIKDFLTGEIIPKATISLSSKADVINAIANDSGMLITDKLKSGSQYDITVSSAGYKTFTTAVKGKEQEILLQRDIKENNNVIVIAYPNIRRKGCCCCGLCEKKGKTIESGIEKAFIVKSVYPNPVQRNNVFNLELENEKDETMQLSITSLNGSIVSLRSQKITKGFNHFSITADAKWAAGIYIIQVRNQKRLLIKQEKLIVQ